MQSCNCSVPIPVFLIRHHPPPLRRVPRRLALLLHLRRPQIARRDGAAEGSRARDLLFVRGYVVEREAGGAIEFAHGLGQQDGPAALDGDRVRLGQVVGGEDARLVELGAELAIHALDVAHLGGLQQGYALAVADGAQVADLSMVGGVTAGLALGALGDVVCHLGQGLGGGDADTGWDARIPHAIALDANEEGGWRWRTSWLMSSMRSTWWSSAGEGKPAATVTRAACTQTGARVTGTGIMGCRGVGCMAVQCCFFVQHDTAVRMIALGQISCRSTLRPSPHHEMVSCGGS